MNKKSLAQLETNYTVDLDYVHIRLEKFGTPRKFVRFHLLALFIYKTRNEIIEIWIPKSFGPMWAEV